MGVRVLYIGGSGRSGSTLLDRILGQVRGYHSVGELVHIWRRGVGDNQLCGCGERFRECPLWRKVGEEAFGGWDAVDAEETLRLQRRVDRNRYIPLMIAPWLSRRYRRDLARYASLVGRLFAAIGDAGGADLVVDSTKHASSAFLLRRVPGIEVRVVHLVRDARGVAYSWTKEIRKPEVTEREEYMPRYHPARMGGRWLAYNILFHVLAALGVPRLFVRYESLISDPRGEVERILAFAGSRPVDMSFIHEHHVELEPTHSVAGNPMRFRQGRVELLEDREWRTAMDPWMRRAVSLVTWPLMRAYGFRRDRG